MHPYANDLEACRKDQERCAYIRDGGHDGATVIYRGNWWVVVQHYAGDKVERAEEVALVRLDSGDTDALTDASLACDLGGKGVWLVDAGRLDELTESFGDSLQVIWRSEGASV